MLATMRRLHPRGRNCRGVAVDADGAMLGPDCVLVRRTPAGFRTLAPHEAATIQKTILGPRCEPDWLFDQARRIADALANGEVALAQIYGLRIPIADLDDAILQCLAATSHILKANFDPTQPRVPAGHPDGGQWIDTGASDEDAASTDADDDEGWPADAGDEEFGEDDPFGTEDYSPDGESEGTSSTPPPDHGGNDPPQIPSEPPGAPKAQNRIARRSAEWLARAIALGLVEQVRSFWAIKRRGCSAVSRRPAREISAAASI